MLLARHGLQAASSAAQLHVEQASLDSLRCMAQDGYRPLRKEQLPQSILKSRALFAESRCLQEGLPLGITRLVKRRFYLVEQARIANMIGAAACLLH